jgi:nitroreductase
MNAIPAALGLTSEQIQGLLGTAGRAPSLHNAQPWRFRLTPQTIELHGDPARSLPVIDPDGRAMRMACGAALFNLRLALLGLGIRPTVTVLPDRTRPTLVATVRHGGHKLATPEERDLLGAVPRRRTNRQPFTGTEPTPGELQALRRAALDEGAWLHIVQDPDERDRLQQLAAQAHAEQEHDPAFRAEIRRWTATGPGRDDGVPAAAGGPMPAPVHRWVMRDFRGPDATVGPAADFEEQPVIAVLTAHQSGDRADVAVGQALQRVLLTATVQGLAVSFLSQVVEVPRTRDELRRLIGEAHPPQAVLRIGRGYPVIATPRRPVADLVEVERELPAADPAAGAR